MNYSRQAVVRLMTVVLLGLLPAVSLAWKSGGQALCSQAQRLLGDVSG
jgi:hypothetical protein